MVKAQFRNATREVFYWDTLGSVIRAQIWHMNIFTAAMIDTTKPENLRDQSLKIAARRHFKPSKVARVFTWFLHYHRAIHYLRSMRVENMNILDPLLVEFKNLRIAEACDAKLVNRDFPSRDCEIVAHQGAGSVTARGMSAWPADAPDLRLVARDPLGVRRVVEWKDSADLRNYSNMFASLFEGDVGKSGEFFVDLFRQTPWLVGKIGGSDKAWGLRSPRRRVRVAQSRRAES